MHKVKEAKWEPKWAEEEQDIFQDNRITELLEDDEIDYQEEAFMRGYERAYEKRFHDWYDEPN